MMSVYTSRDKDLVLIEKIEKGCWVNLIDPTEDEIYNLSMQLDIDSDFIRSALDEEERSRIEYDVETEDVLVIVDAPFEEEDESKGYSTLPIAIIYTKQCVVTICLKQSAVLNGFISGKVKTFLTYKKSRFILQILYRNATLFLLCLKQIDKKIENVKQKIHKSMRNKEIIQLLDLETSLVYFNTSLRANELVMQKLLKLEFMKLYPEDKDLLEDTIIENKQAMEMAKIYSNILGGTMEAFGSIISNNLNIDMKFLTSVTIIMNIPNMIFGFYGMNVYIPFQENTSYIWLILFGTIIFCAILALIMIKRKMF